MTVGAIQFDAIFSDADFLRVADASGLAPLTFNPPSPDALGRFLSSMSGDKPEIGSIRLAMESIAQVHALQMAYKIVEHSPLWGTKQGDFLLHIQSALDAVVPVLGVLIIANSYVEGTVRLTGQKFTANEVGLWAARRMILYYLLILIDDNSRPDDWLDIRDKQPLQNVLAYLGYRSE
jgi:hypothetical protein